MSKVAALEDERAVALADGAGSKRTTRLRTRGCLLERQRPRIEIRPEGLLDRYRSLEGNGDDLSHRIRPERLQARGDLSLRTIALDRPEERSNSGPVLPYRLKTAEDEHHGEREDRELQNAITETQRLREALVGGIHRIAKICFRSRIGDDREFRGLLATRRFFDLAVFLSERLE